jgi:SLT domain-containing protein
MQTIDPTFRAYHFPGTSNDVYDPLANVLASMRYALSRYGSLAAAYNRAGGYAARHGLRARDRLTYQCTRRGGLFPDRNQRRRAGTARGRFPAVVLQIDGPRRRELPRQEWRAWPGSALRVVDYADAANQRAVFSS